MKRQIFEVYAKVVDANGTYNTLSGYPKYFDSHVYDDDIDKARNRAIGAYCSCLSSMYTTDTRQLQTAILMTADGFILRSESIGEIADLPDEES